MDHDFLFDGQLIEISRVQPAHIWILDGQLDAIPKAVNDHELYMALKNINALIGEIKKYPHEKEYFRVEISSLSYRPSLVLDSKFSNLYLVFRGLQLDNIYQSESYPAKFIDCSIGEFRVSHRKANLVFFNTHVGTLLSIDTALENIRFVKGSIDIIRGSKDHSNLQFTETQIGRFDLPSGSLSDVEFYKSTFVKAPDFVKIELSETVNFIDCRFNDVSSSAAFIYRNIKSKMKSNHNDMADAYFNTLELKCRHFDATSKPESFFSRSYFFINDYGHDAFRPLDHLWKLFVVAWCFFEVSIILGGSYVSKEILDSVDIILESTYLAFISVLGPFRVLGGFKPIQYLTPISEVGMFFFSAASSLLIFFLVLGIRKRFKID